jgi:hypothetical protein
LAKLYTVCWATEFNSDIVYHQQYITDNLITILLSKNHKGIRHSLIQMYKMDISVSQNWPQKCLTKRTSNTASPIGQPVLPRSAYQQHCLTNWTTGAPSLSVPATLAHQVEHFFVGFMGEPIGQLYASANEGEFIIIPFTLQRRMQHSNIASSYKLDMNFTTTSRALQLTH